MAAEAAQVTVDLDPTINKDIASLSKRLVLLARDGDRCAFEQLLILHEKQVLFTAARVLGRQEDAKDAAQEVFLRLYRFLPGIKPEAVRPWLYSVTINVCRDIAKKRRKSTFVQLNEKTLAAESKVARPESMESKFVLDEQRQILKIALRSLPFKERAALVLRDIEGLSTEETAKILGSLVTTVRSQISTARVKVKLFCDRFQERPK